MPAKLAIGGQQPLIVFARLDRAHRQDESWLDAVGQRPGGHRRWNAFGYDLDLVLEARNLVQLEQITPRRLRRHDDGGRLAQRPRKHGAEVHPLLPRHLLGPDAECKVVDEDGRGRRAGVPEGWAGPVRIKDGVAFELRLDHREPPRLHHELVAIGRQHSLAVELPKGRRSIAAAQEDEPVAGAAFNQGSRELDRHRQHPHALGPPAGRDVDREPAHHMNVEGKDPRAPSAGRG